jgi:hypothetical protein
MAESKHALFNRPGAIETPLSVAETLALESGFRRKVFHEIGAEGFPEREIFSGKDNDAAC